ncbi:MAG: NAD(P)/FAD-dependent oxidoreductase [Eubacteriales bacterium]
MMKDAVKKENKPCEYYDEKKLVVIGAGPAGLAAALGAVEAGTDPSDILIIEREHELGGILNQCIHTGFGLHLFGRELTGTEYASIFIDKVKEKGINYITDSTVLDMNRNKEISIVSPKYGYGIIKAEAIILAMGCRERSRGALNIAGTRPAGIFSAGTAQRFVNIDGYLPGKNVVILGSGDIGLIMARRLTLEGAKVLCVLEIMDRPGGLARNIAQCLDDFGIPLYLSHTVTKIFGKERLSGVEISEVDKNFKPIKGTERVIECDTLLLSCGLIPENELTKGAGIPLDPKTSGALVNQFCETGDDGVFACGNVLHVHDLVDYVTEESKKAGRAASLYLNKKISKTGKTVKIIPGRNVRYTVPQRYEPIEKEDGWEIYFRVKEPCKNCTVSLNVAGKEIFSAKKIRLSPGEMEKIKITPELAKIISENDDATVNVSEGAEK